MTGLSSVAVVVPAYCPSDALVDLCHALSDSSFGLVLVVDDGSPSEYKTIFSELKKIDKIKVIAHEKNKGKGAALKTAFFSVQQEHTDITHVVTADADGQHQSCDIRRVAETSIIEVNAVVLGVRAFHDDVPLRSRFGNRLTRSVFRLFSGKEVSDTQTGLRGIPVEYLLDFVEIDKDRYEYEMEMMLKAISSDMPIKEVSIATIYIDGNSSSHFRPIVDSLKIYFVFFRYSLASMASFVVDIVAFAAMLYVSSGNILISTYIARLLSGTFNFFANRSVVFQNHGPRRLGYQVFSYIALAVCIATLSGLSVSALADRTPIHPVTIKIFVDIMLFVLSFLTQRFLIFNIDKRSI